VRNEGEEQMSAKTETVVELAPEVRRPDPTGKDTAQSPGLLRLEGISPRSTAAKGIFFQTAINEPGTRSIPPTCCAGTRESITAITGKNGST
jgi:hypothetical protein